MPSLTTMLTAWAVAGPLLAGGVTWGAMRIRSAILIDAAHQSERAIQVGVCQSQLSEQANTLTANTMAGIGAAGAAADAIPMAPEDRAAIVALCRADPACRDRGTLP